MLHLAVARGSPASQQVSPLKDPLISLYSPDQTVLVIWSYSYFSVISYVITQMGVLDICRTTLD